MAEIDEQKEKVTFWRNLFFVLLATIFGLVAYTFENFDKLSNIKLIIIDITGFFMFIGNIFILIKLKKEIEKLKDL